MIKFIWLIFTVSSYVAGDILARYYAETKSLKLLIFTLFIYFLASWGTIKGLGNSSLSWFLILMPALNLVAGVTAGHLIFKESLNTGQYLGGGIILIGVLTVIFYSK